MEETDPGAIDILLIALSRLAKKKNLIVDHLRTLYQKLKGKGIVPNMLTSPEMWVCIALLAYSLVLLLVGIKSKRLTLSVFICAVAFGCLSAVEDPIFRAFSGCLDYLFKKSKPGFIRLILSDKRMPVLITSIAATLAALLCLSVLSYIVCGIIAFEIYHVVDSVLGAKGGYHILVICAISLALMLLLNKVLRIMLNTILSLIFASNGSYLFWTMAYVTTGYPRGFLGFDIYALDSGRWQSFDFKCNFALWAILALVGFRYQLSFKTLINS